MPYTTNPFDLENIISPHQKTIGIHPYPNSIYDAIQNHRNSKRSEDPSLRGVVHNLIYDLKTKVCDWVDANTSNISSSDNPIKKKVPQPGSNEKPLIPTGESEDNLPPIYSSTSPDKVIPLNIEHSNNITSIKDIYIKPNETATELFLQQVLPDIEDPNVLYNIELLLKYEPVDNKIHKMTIDELASDNKDYRSNIMLNLENLSSGEPKIEQPNSLSPDNLDKLDNPVGYISSLKDYLNTLTYLNTLSINPFLSDEIKTELNKIVGYFGGIIEYIQKQEMIRNKQLQEQEMIRNTQLQEILKGEITTLSLGKITLSYNPRNPQEAQNIVEGLARPLRDIENAYLAGGTLEESEANAREKIAEYNTMPVKIRYNSVLLSFSDH